MVAVYNVANETYNTFRHRSVWMKSVVVGIAPHIDTDEVADVRWNFAFHDRSVSSNDILVVGFHFVVLNYS